MVKHEVHVIHKPKQAPVVDRVPNLTIECPTSSTNNTELERNLSIAFDTYHHLADPAALMPQHSANKHMLIQVVHK